MAGKTPSDQDGENVTEKLICYHCDKGVLDATFCKKCQMPYHPSCAAQSGFLPNKAVKKCCDLAYVFNKLWKSTIVPAIDERVDKKIKEATKALDKQINGIQNTCNKHATDCKKQIADLKEEWQDKFDAMQEKYESSIHENEERIITEIKQRELRSKNIILRNMQENNDANDLETVKNILSQIPIDNIENIKVQRLGKKTDDKVRPLKLKMQSAHDVAKVFKDIKKLKGHLPDNVFITNDSTPSQTKYYFNIKDQLKERIAKGEKDIKLQTIKGIPTIVKKQNDDTSKNLEARVPSSESTQEN